MQGMKKEDTTGVCVCDGRSLLFVWISKIGGNKGKVIIAIRIMG